MDTLVISSQAMSAVQPTHSSSSSASKVEAQAETTPFQQRLEQYVSQTNSKSSTSPNAESSEMEVTVAEEVAVIDANPLLTADELKAMIEALLSDIDQLTDAPLSLEDQIALEDLSAQLAAILKLFSVNKETLDSVVLNQSSGNDNASFQSPQITVEVNNELLFKLQEQLLMLQQSLKDGNLKAVQGQEPDQFIAQALNNLNDLLEGTKKNSRALMEVIVVESSHTDEQLSVNQVKNASFEQLKQLAKIAEYSQLTSQASGQVTVTSDQSSEAVTANQLQVMTPLSAQLNEVVSKMKGQSQVATAFTPVNQFAETVKGMVLQKFDLTQFTNGLSQARIMLTPENLGSVDIRLTMQNGVLTALFAAETVMGKEALENQMSILRGALGAQGVTIERLEVTQASFAEQLSEEQEHKQERETEEPEDSDEDESFEEELEASVMNQELGFGRSVDEVI